MPSLRTRKRDPEYRRALESDGMTPVDGVAWWSSPTKAEVGREETLEAFAAQILSGSFCA